MSFDENEAGAAAGAEDPDSVHAARPRRIGSRPQDGTVDAPQTMVRNTPAVQGPEYGTADNDDNDGGGSNGDDTGENAGSTGNERGDRELVDKDARVKSDLSRTRTPASGKARMKLIVRSKYWGRSLAGRVTREIDNPHAPYHTISSQAFIHKNGPYWGCCPQQGSRVLDLNEEHFLEHHPGQWDLYHTSTAGVPSTGHIIHDFFLLPKHQNIVNVSRRTAMDGWLYIGTANASTMRAELEYLLLPYFQNPKGTNVDSELMHHVHVQIMMDSATDKEMTRKSKKELASKASSSAPAPSSPSTEPNAGNRKMPITSSEGQSNVRSSVEAERSPVVESRDTNSTETSSHATAGSRPSGRRQPAVPPLNWNQPNVVVTQDLSWRQHPPMHHPPMYAPSHFAYAWYPTQIGAEHPGWFVNGVAPSAVPPYGWDPTNNPYVWIDDPRDPSHGMPHLNQPYPPHNGWTG